MKKYCNSVALKRKVPVSLNDNDASDQTSIYPPENLKRMIEERAEDNMESVSKTVCKICREFFKSNPPRTRSDIKD